MLNVELIGGQVRITLLIANYTLKVRTEPYPFAQNHQDK